MKKKQEKPRKLKVKKLTLDKETLSQLQQVVGGASEGPIICWFSDCNPCFNAE